MTFTPRISPYDCIVFCNAVTVNFARNDNRPMPVLNLPILVQGFEDWLNWMRNLLLIQTEIANDDSEMEFVGDWR